MRKNIDLKNRIVEMYDVDTGLHENEIVSYLDRNMRVSFHSARFSNNRYVFIGDPKDSLPNAITVNGYRRKQPGETISVDIK